MRLHVGAMADTSAWADTDYRGRVFERTSRAMTRLSAGMFGLAAPILKGGGGWKGAAARHRSFKAGVEGDDQFPAIRPPHLSAAAGQRPPPTRAGHWKRIVGWNGMQALKTGAFGPLWEFDWSSKAI